MKIKLNIRTFKDTMNPGCWTATVTTFTPDGQEHGFYEDGDSEENVLSLACQSLEEFILKVKAQS